jgi:hypothetical protein
VVQQRSNVTRACRIFRYISTGNKVLGLHPILLTPSLQSAHPLALLCLFLFRVSAILLYILSGFFIDNYVISVGHDAFLFEYLSEFNVDRGGRGITRGGLLELSSKSLSSSLCLLRVANETNDVECCWPNSGRFAFLESGR